MIQERFYFEIRFEDTLEEMIREYLNKTGRSLSLLTEKAFRFTAELHNRGKVPFIRHSSFLGRENKENRFSPMIILKADVHEMVRNFAFAYRRSMAEILRISLELFLTAEKTNCGKLEDNIHYYNTPTHSIIKTTALLIPAFPPGISPENYTIPIYLSG